MNMIDLRSDTITKPTEAMWQAMAAADVGDDVFKEDPSINRLQEMAAQILGKEDAIFVPSGTMGNLVAVLTHCGRGDEAIMGDLGHTFLFEGGGISAIGGVFPHTLPNQPDGSLKIDDIRGAIRPDDDHHPISRLIILENTHNRCGGVVLPMGYTEMVRVLAHERHLLMHLDGARLFNAAAYCKVPAEVIARPFDSVTFCLSKALCAPVGSVLCGSQEFIKKARRIRKVLGGGMRQAGVIAAAGIVALGQMADRLHEDHYRASMLAESLSQIPYLELPFGMPQTNMVFVDLRSGDNRTAKEIAALLKQQGILVGVIGGKKFRLVTHYWINDDDVANTFQAFSEVLS